MTGDPYVASKALYHTDRIIGLKKGGVISPTLIQVDPMSYCNDNCKFCSYREETMYNNSMLKLIDANQKDVTDHMGGVGKPTEQGTWPEWLADSLGRQMVDANIPAIEITGGGEPTLWRGFDRLVQSCLAYKRDVGLVTNASNLNDERAKFLSKCVWVRTSIDAATKETHQKVHRTANQDFERRIENLRRLVAYKLSQKTNCVIGVSFVVQKENMHEIEQSVKLFREIGVDNIRFTLMYDKNANAGLDEMQRNEMKFQIEDSKKYSTDKFAVLFDDSRLWTYSKPNNDFKKCYLQNFVWAIGADCKVYPCCIMKYNPDYAYADLREQTLLSMVRDMNFQARQNNLDVTKCFPCWLRTRNQALAQAMEEPLHSNFL